MFRIETQHGWWLVTHPDHARLAAAFAREWGNQQFRNPEPRTRVLRAIASHDDGWREHDASPSITRDGRPAAFSVEQVGNSLAFQDDRFAFPDMDLAAYLALRARTVRHVVGEDAYSALLIAMHTGKLLTRHLDHTSLTSHQLSLLNRFLREEDEFQQQLRSIIDEDAYLTAREKQDAVIEENFRLLQACDHLSQLAGIAFDQPFHLLHPLALRDGGTTPVQVLPLAPRHFRLTPWTFAEPEMRFEFPARHVIGRSFSSAESLAETYNAAPIETLSILLSA